MTLPSGWSTGVLTWAVNHQEIFEILALAWFGAGAIVSGLAAVWPDYATRPKVPRFIIGALEPFVISVGKWIGWGVRAILKKFGLGDGPNGNGKQPPVAPLPPNWKPEGSG